MSNKYGLILFGILLFSFGCKKNTENIFTSSSYPLAVGNWWQYELISFYGTDTFMLSVVSSTKIGSSMQYNCNFIGSGGSGSAGYFLLSDTAMSFINSTPDPYNTPFPNFHFKFPLETGQYWQGAFPGDSTLVVGVANDCDGSYGSTYGPCFSTVESYDLPHNFKVNHMLLTPKVGLVTQSIDFNSDTAGKTASYGGGIQIQQSIALISYHVQQ